MKRDFHQADYGIVSEKYFDGFVVATPPKTHYQLTKMILNNDKHVLVEKPLTLKYEQSEKLVNLAMKKESQKLLGSLRQKAIDELRRTHAGFVDTMPQTAAMKRGS